MMISNSTPDGHKHLCFVVFWHNIGSDTTSTGIVFISLSIFSMMIITAAMNVNKVAKLIRRQHRLQLLFTTNVVFGSIISKSFFEYPISLKYLSQVESFYRYSDFPLIDFTMTVKESISSSSEIAE